MNKFQTFIYLNILCLIMIGLSFLINKYPNGIGGGFIVYILMCIFIILSIINKILKQLYIYFSLILANIFIMNSLPNLKVQDSISTIFHFIFLVPFILISFTYILIVRLPFKELSAFNEIEKQNFKKLSVPLFLPIIFFGIVFNLLSGSMLSFIQEVEPHLIENPILILSYLSIGWIVVSFIITWAFLRKVKKEEIKSIFPTQIKNIFGLKVYNTNKIKKFFILILIIIIGLGTIFEMTRRLWIIWIEVILLILFISLTLWEIYEPLLSKRQK